MSFHQNLDTTNRLLHEMVGDPDRAVKAYSLGLVSALAEKDGITASDEVLKAAASCETLQSAVELYTVFSELRRADT